KDPWFTYFVRLELEQLDRLDAIFRALRNKKCVPSGLLKAVHKAAKLERVRRERQRTIDAMMAPVRETGPVTYDHFVGHMPSGGYVFMPTGDLWPAKSVDARLPPREVSESAEPIKPSTWIDRYQPVEQMTWAPGEPKILPDRLILDGGWVH